MLIRTTSVLSRSSWATSRQMMGRGGDPFEIASSSRDRSELTDFEDTPMSLVSRQPLNPTSIPSGTRPEGGAETSPDDDA